MDQRSGPGFSQLTLIPAQHRLIGPPCCHRYEGVATMSRIYADNSQAIGNTPLVELPPFSPRPGVRLFAKLENPLSVFFGRNKVKMTQLGNAMAQSIVDRPGG